MRKNEVIEIVKKSDGMGLVINDAFLYQAKELAAANGLHFSYNSLLGLAALLKAVYKGIKFNFPVVLASGL